jgi:hypothetical protein
MASLDQNTDGGGCYEPGYIGKGPSTKNNLVVSLESEH